MAWDYCDISMSWEFLRAWRSAVVCEGLCPKTTDELNIDHKYGNLSHCVTTKGPNSYFDSFTFIHTIFNTREEHSVHLAQYIAHKICCLWGKLQVTILYSIGKVLCTWTHLQINIGQRDDCNQSRSHDGLLYMTKHGHTCKNPDQEIDSTVYRPKTLN